MNKKIAVVGATGAVGEELVKILAERGYDPRNLRLFASKRSANVWIPYGTNGSKIRIEELNSGSFQGIDIALFATPNDIARTWVPIARDAGCIVIDNSSVFRMENDVPLVIPEVNPDAVKAHRGIIANPNCTTIITLMALAPLDRELVATKVHATSFQAVSGAGKEGVAELARQIEHYRAGSVVANECFPHQIAFNVIPEVGTPNDKNHMTSEEIKLNVESRKILSSSRIHVSAICMRAPIYRAHTVAVFAEFDEGFTRAQAVDILNHAEGLTVLDDLENHKYPTPLQATDKDDCLVGRIRCVPKNTLAFVVCGDQLRKGAALNAIQIMEML